MDLVTGGVEMNPGPPVEQMKIDHILVYDKKQDKEGKVINQMSETHEQEMSEMKKGTNPLRPKFEGLSEVLPEMIKDYGQRKQTIRKCEMRYKKNCDKG